jgi:hypothetical protein
MWSNSGPKHLYREAHRRKQLAKQAVELVAKSTAPACHDLIVNLAEIETDR